MWLLAGGAAGAPPASPTVWLVVGASDATPAGVARAARALGGKKPEALVFQTRDCGEKRNVFGVALDVADSPEAAKTALQQAAAHVKGAYVKRCAVVPQSLLALRVHAVDPSIAGVPDDAINWEDDDRVSTAMALPGRRTLLVQRTFAADDPEDPEEGKHVRVALVDSAGARKTLLEDCSSPERATSSGELLAFQCVGETAADYSVHQIFVFQQDGRQVTKVDWCKNPKFVDRSTLLCTAESITARGIKFRPKRVALPR